MHASTPGSLDCLRSLQSESRILLVLHSCKKIFVLCPNPKGAHLAATSHSLTGAKNSFEQIEGPHRFAFASAADKYSQPSRLSPAIAATNMHLKRSADGQERVTYVDCNAVLLKQVSFPFLLRAA